MVNNRVRKLKRVEISQQNLIALAERALAQEVWHARNQYWDAMRMKERTPVRVMKRRCGMCQKILRLFQRRYGLQIMDVDEVLNHRLELNQYSTILK